MLYCCPVNPKKAKSGLHESLNIPDINRKFELFFYLYIKSFIYTQIVTHLFDQNSKQ